MYLSVVTLIVPAVLVSVTNGQFPVPRRHGGMGHMIDGCGPAFHCDLMCHHGYQWDQHGCLCACAMPESGGRMSHGIVPQGSAPAYVNPCVTGLLTCPLRCTNGYRTGYNGCQYCLCAKEARMVTALTDDNVGPVYNNPCSNAPPNCDAPCPPGRKFATGPNGCQFCECQAPVTSTQSPGCDVKMLECQLKCPTGFFMADKQACDHCVCEADIYSAAGIPDDRKPRVRLDSPCVLGLDLCNIACRSGYQQGPRSCNFCACAT